MTPYDQWIVSIVRAGSRAEANRILADVMLDTHISAAEWLRLCRIASAIYPSRCVIKQNKKTVS